MRKTATYLADYVLFKVAMEEAIKEGGFQDVVRKFGGNWPHVFKRIGERIAVADRGHAEKVIESAAKNLGKAPQHDWFRPIQRGKSVIGYIVGRGRYVSSVYSPAMTPRGRRW